MSASGGFRELVEAIRLRPARVWRDWSDEHILREIASAEKAVKRGEATATKLTEEWKAELAYRDALSKVNPAAVEELVAAASGVLEQVRRVYGGPQSGKLTLHERCERLRAVLTAFGEPERKEE